MTHIQRHDQHPLVFDIYLDPLIPIVTEVIWFNYSEISVGHQMAPHLHHYHQLDVILAGEFTLTLDEENQTGQPGDAWIIPPLIWHGVNSPHPFRYCSIKFHLAPRFWPMLGTVFQRFSIPEHVRASVDALGKRSILSPPGISQHAAAIVSLCLVELIDQRLNNPEKESIDERLDEFRQLLWPLLEQVQKKPSIKQNVTQMAEDLGLSVDYFSRCFHRIVGQTPQRYILETVIRKSAAELHEVPMLPIKEIAYRAGYSTSQGFSRAFTKVFKISPAAYRRLMPEVE